MELVITRVPLCETGERPIVPEAVIPKRKFLYPAPSLKASVKTTVMVRLAGLILDNMTGGKVVTTRDLYYQDVELFRNQRVVNSSVVQLCRMLQVYRRDLNIVPAPNGLIFGDVTVIFRDEGIYDIQRANGPAIIPVGSEILHLTFSQTPEFILVVEKEAVFAHLHRELPGGLVMTGKGFPDHYTRKFLKALVDACPTTPAFGLVDSDVHGILILKTYKTGSSSYVEVHEPIDQLKYLGVRLLDYKEGLVNSTYRDKRLAMSTLGKPWMVHVDHAEWRRELQRGMFMGKKAEMNVLDQEHLGRLAQYVKARIVEHQFPAKPKKPTLVTYGRRLRYTDVRFRVIPMGIPKLRPAVKHESLPVIKMELDSDSELGSSIPSSELASELASEPVPANPAGELFVEEVDHKPEPPSETDNSVDPFLRNLKRKRIN